MYLEATGLSPKNALTDNIEKVIWPDVVFQTFQGYPPWRLLI